MAVPKKKKSHQKVLLKKRSMYNNGLRLLNKQIYKNNSNNNLKTLSF